MTPSQLSRSILAAILILATPASALADLRYSVEFAPRDVLDFILDSTDLTDASSPLTRIERIYESKNTHSGWFGYGWGSRYETYLEFEPDGSIVAKDYGGGSETAFIPEGGLRSTEQLVTEVMNAAVTTSMFGSDAAKKAYLAKLRGDQDFLKSEWTTFRASGLINEPLPPVGQALYDASRRQKIERVPEGFQRQSLSKTFKAYGAIGSFGGDFEAFDLQGKILRIWDNDNNFVAIRYNSKQQPKEIYNNRGLRFRLAFDNRGLLQHIRDWRGRIASYAYSYNSQNKDGKFWGWDLTQSVDTQGQAYTYRYDRDHDLTRIRRAGGNVMEMAYTGTTGRVAHVTASSGSDSEYSYDYDVDTMARVVTVEQREPGHAALKSTFVYMYAPDGEYIDEVLQSNGAMTSDRSFDASGNVVSTKTSPGSFAQMSGRTVVFYERLADTLFDGKVLADAQAVYKQAAAQEGGSIAGWRAFFTQALAAGPNDLPELGSSDNTVVHNCKVSKVAGWRLSCNDARGYIGPGSLPQLAADVSAALPGFTMKKDAYGYPRWANTENVIVSVEKPRSSTDDWGIRFTSPPRSVAAVASNVSQWRTFFDKVLPVAPANFLPIRGAQESTSRQGTYYAVSGSFYSALARICNVVVRDQRWAVLCINSPLYVGVYAVDQLAADITAALPPGFTRGTDSVGDPEWKSATTVVVLLDPGSVSPGWGIAVGTLH